MSSSPTSSSSSDPSGSRPALADLSDVVCPVTIVLATIVLSTRRCLALGPGSLVKLNRSAGEDLDVMINGIVIAHGEVVIMDDHTSIRITEIAAGPLERLP